MSWLDVSGWKKTQLGDVARVINGRAYKQSELLDSGTPVIRIQNLNGGDSWYYSDLSLPEDKYCEEGDLLFAWSATFGPYIWWGDKSIYHYHIWKIEPCNGSINKSYLYYTLDYLTHILKSHGQSGLGMVHITKTFMEGYKLTLPPLPEQQKIAEILSCWDKAIEQTEKLIDAKTKLKKGLMQQLLTGRDRLAKFEAAPWSLADLGTLAHIRRGAPPRPISDKKYFSSDGRGWVRISDVTACSKFLRTTEQRLSQLGESKSVPVDPGQLIMSICATIGVPRIVDFPCCIHDGFVLISDYADDLDTDFLFYTLGHQTDRLASSGQPGTQKNLNTSLVKKIQIPAISLEEQKAIARLFDGLLEEIESLQKLRSNFEKQKKGLMQQLLTGKTRVKV